MINVPSFARLTLCGPPNWLTAGPIAMDPEITPRSAQLSPYSPHTYSEPYLAVRLARLAPASPSPTAAGLLPWP